MKPRLRRGSGALRAPDVGFSYDFIDFLYIFHIFLGIGGIQPLRKLCPLWKLCPYVYSVLYSNPSMLLAGHVSRAICQVELPLPRQAGHR